MSQLPNIHQRMLACMKAVGYVQKESKKVNNQYTFVSHDAVSAACRPAFIENGILPVPHVTSTENNGNRVEIHMTVDFINVDNPEDKVSVESFGFGIDPQDKGPGKAMSYAYKYALLKALALETGDDPERDVINHEPPATATVATPAADISEDVKAAIELLDGCAYPDEAKDLWRSIKPEVKKHPDVIAAKDRAKECQP